MLSLMSSSAGFLTSFNLLSRFEIQKPTIPYSQCSSHTSHPSCDTLEDMTTDSMEFTGNDYRTSKRKVRVFHTALSLPRSLCYDQTLTRDDCWYITSDIFDGPSLDKNAVPQSGKP